jgi:hypothetical protein
MNALLRSDVPRWALMWTIALGLYAACKWITWQRSTVMHAPAWRQAAYLVAWPGMDADGFLDATSAGRRCAALEWRQTAARIAVGVLLLFGVARAIPSEYPLAVGWTGMAGAILCLHFGVFHLLSCAWRGAGVDARPLMNHPLEASSLGDFWGRRWNTAFRDLTHRFLFRPVAQRFGVRVGLVAGFLASGVVHDLVISVPAGGGYGRPTLYFAIQGASVLIERSPFGRRKGLDAGWRGRLLAAAALVAPAGLLFHPPFVVGVIVPLMRAIGAL